MIGCKSILTAFGFILNKGPFSTTLPFDVVLIKWLIVTIPYSSIKSKCEIICILVYSSFLNWKYSVAFSIKDSAETQNVSLYFSNNLLSNVSNFYAMKSPIVNLSEFTSLPVAFACVRLI